MNKPSHREIAILAIGFVLLLVCLNGAEARAESWLPCTVEEYVPLGTGEVPSANQLENDMKLARRLGGSEEAISLLCRAAASGSSHAAYVLGLAMDPYVPNHLQVDQNVGQAIYWLTRAAEGGHAEAAWTLMLFYLDAEHMPQDLTMARKWAQRAAANGHPRAGKILSAIDHAISEDE